MPNRHRLLPTIALLALLPLLAQGAAAATSVPIVNPGFDADPLADGSFEVSGITGWTTAPGFGQGIYNPTASDYVDPIPSGQNVGYSNSTAGRLSQVLTTQLEANTRYVLEVEIGWNNHDPFAGYIVRLLAGGNLLAEDDSSQMPPQGRFPRGAGDADPASFTVQVYDEDGAPVGAPQEVRTASHAIELAASDFTGLAFGTLGFDFTDGSGGVAYAEYSAEGRFSVGTVSQCEEARFCEEDCCAPGAPKATTPELTYPAGSVVDGVAIDDCDAAISDLLRSLESFHYRNACQQAYGGALPDRVLGARVVSCEVQGNGDVVAVVESCCPPPE